jgi:hypothetical protein
VRTVGASAVAAAPVGCSSSCLARATNVTCSSDERHRCTRPVVPLGLSTLVRMLKSMIWSRRHRRSWRCRQLDTVRRDVAKAAWASATQANSDNIAFSPTDRLLQDYVQSRSITGLDTCAAHGRDVLEPFLPTARTAVTCFAQPRNLTQIGIFKTRPLAHAYAYIDDRANNAIPYMAYEMSLRYSATCGATGIQDGPSKQLAGISKT